MKNVLIIVNALLILSVGFLLFKHFGSSKSTFNHSETVGNQKTPAAVQKVMFAYIETDSIEQRYELAKKVQEEIRKKQSALSAEMGRMEQNYKNKLAGYQRKGPEMTEAEAEAARQDIESSQVKIMEKRQSLTEDFNNFVAQKNMSVINEIKTYLKDYNKEGKYSFIFSYDPGLFYYKDSAYDITSDVLKGLNDQYKNKKK